GAAVPTGKSGARTNARRGDDRHVTGGRTATPPVGTAGAGVNHSERAGREASLVERVGSRDLRRRFHRRRARLASLAARPSAGRFSCCGQVARTALQDLPSGFAISTLLLFVTIRRTVHCVSSKDSALKFGAKAYVSNG